MNEIWCKYNYDQGGSTGVVPHATPQIHPDHDVADRPGAESVSMFVLVGVGQKQNTCTSVT